MAGGTGSGAGGQVRFERVRSGIGASRMRHWHFQEVMRHSGAMRVPPASFRVAALLLLLAAALRPAAAADKSECSLT